MTTLLENNLYKLIEEDNELIIYSKVDDSDPLAIYSKEEEEKAKKDFNDLLGQAELQANI